MATAFALVLKRHRAAKGMTQELLAEKADLHTTYIGLIERSLRNPSLNVAKAIANALETPLTQIISEAEQMCDKRTR
jgi:transcriptional regulator with XRE-family HTH domain